MDYFKTLYFWVWFRILFVPTFTDVPTFSKLCICVPTFAYLNALIFLNFLI